MVTADFLVPIKWPEIVVALVAPIGTGMQTFKKTAESELKRAGYKPHIIKVTDLLKEFAGEFDLVETPEEARYDSYIVAGNKLRERMGRDDAFALLTIAAITELRKTLTTAVDIPATRTAYIISQLKRPEEIRTLRKVYGRAFLQFSAYCPKEIRTKRLSQRIWESHGKDKKRENYIGAAANLIARDESEEENEFGQRVRDTFHLADFIVDATSDETLEGSCRRSVELAFGNPFITPTRDEQGIFLARAAALRSADLSRQVGAVITARDGEVISVGCNEVPKALGGTYWEGDKPDHRDFQLGYDPSAKAKKELFHDTLRRLHQAGWFNAQLSSGNVDDLVDKATQGPDAPLQDAHVGDILEFGRVVHAEMNALMTAARRGIAVDGATMYVTTFATAALAPSFPQEYQESSIWSRTPRVKRSSSMTAKHKPSRSAQTRKRPASSSLLVSPHHVIRIFSREGCAKRKVARHRNGKCRVRHPLSSALFRPTF